MEQLLELVMGELLKGAIAKLGPKVLSSELLQACSSELDAIRSGIDILRSHKLDTAKKHLRNSLTILKHDIKNEEGKHMLDEAYNNAIEGSTTVGKTEDKIESMRLIIFCLLMKLLVFACNNVNEKIIEQSIIFKELCQTHLMELNIITDVIQAVQVEHMNKWAKIGSTEENRLELLTSILNIHLDTNIIFYSIKYGYTKDIDSMSSSVEMSQMTLNEYGEREHLWNYQDNLLKFTRELSVFFSDNADVYVHAKFFSKKPLKISAKKFSVFDIFCNLLEKMKEENPSKDNFLKFLNILFMNVENSPECLFKILINFENYPIMVEKVNWDKLSFLSTEGQLEILDKNNFSILYSEFNDKLKKFPKVQDCLRSILEYHFKNMTPNFIDNVINFLSWNDIGLLNSGGSVRASSQDSNHVPENAFSSDSYWMSGLAQPPFNEFIERHLDEPVSVVAFALLCSGHNPPTAFILYGSNELPTEDDTSQECCALCCSKIRQCCSKFFCCSTLWSEIIVITDYKWNKSSFFHLIENPLPFRFYKIKFTETKYSANRPDEPSQVYLDQIKLYTL